MRVRFSSDTQNWWVVLNRIKLSAVNRVDVGSSPTPSAKIMEIWKNNSTCFEVYQIRHQRLWVKTSTEQNWKKQRVRKNTKPFYGWTSTVTTCGTGGGIGKDQIFQTIKEESIKRGNTLEKLNGRNNLPTLSRGETVITHDWYLCIPSSNLGETTTLWRGWTV